MSRSKSLILTLALWISLTMCPQVECGQNGKEEAGVTIELTKLDVNDTTVELHYKIKNGSDHDVWVCDSANVYGVYDIEVFMAKDAQTIVIRRRFDLPIVGIVERIPTSRYVRLRSGEDLTDSLSLDVPVRHSALFKREEANAKYARRLALEISFYNEDLPGLILHILEVGEKLGCTHRYGVVDSNDLEICDRYFGGLVIQGLLKNRPDFSESIIEGGEQVIIPYMRQVLKGEQVLRLEVDGVHIPYGSAPAAEEPANDDVEDTPITMALTKLDVNDTNLELSYKIKNRSDHDIWLCDSIGFGHRFEIYMAKDNQTLMIRRRFEVPTYLLYYEPPEGQYFHLRPDEERAESLSLVVPVQRDFVFSVGVGTSKYARRLVLEIGFYDEDLPGLIHGILEEAEKLGGATLNLDDCNISVIARYFEGLLIAGYFGGLSCFEEYYYKDSSEQIRIPYMHQALEAEHVLQITVDGVLIPYEEVPAEYTQAKEEDEP